jgi:hypothetical protein
LSEVGTFFISGLSDMQNATVILDMFKMTIGLNMMHPWNLPSLLRYSFFLLILLKVGESSKWDNNDVDNGLLDPNHFKVIDHPKSGFWKYVRKLMSFKEETNIESADSQKSGHQSLLHHHEFLEFSDKLFLTSDFGRVNHAVSQIQQDSLENDEVHESSKRKLRDDQFDSEKNSGSVLISNHFVRQLIGVEVNSYGFQTEVVKIERALTVGLTKTGGKNSNLFYDGSNYARDQGNIDSLSNYLLSKFTNQNLAEVHLDDLRMETGRTSKPRRKSVVRPEPDLDPKTQFQCRCEYPNEGIYVKVNQSGKIVKGSGKFRRVLSTIKNISHFRRPSHPRKMILYTNTWDVDKYAVINGTSILPPWHAACVGVVFICSEQSINNCSLWQYRCTTDDFPIHKYKSGSVKIGNEKRNLQSTSNSKDSVPNLNKQEVSAKSSRRAINICKAIIIPKENQFCLSSRSSDAISHKKVPVDQHDTSLEDSINFSPGNSELSINNSSISGPLLLSHPTRMPSKRQNPLTSSLSTSPHDVKSRRQKTNPPTVAPNRKGRLTLPPTKRPTPREAKNTSLQSTDALPTKAPTFRHDREASPNLFGTMKGLVSSTPSRSVTLTPTKIPTPRLHSAVLEEDLPKETLSPSVQRSISPTKLPTPRPFLEYSSFADSQGFVTNTIKETPSKTPPSPITSAPSERCDGYDLSNCLASGNPKNRGSSVEDCSSVDCDYSSRNITVSLLTSGFDPFNQETLLIYNISQSETAYGDRVTFSWTGNCCIRDASYSGSNVSYGFDTKTCSYGVIFMSEFSGSHDFYKVVFAGNVPIQRSSMNVKVSNNNTVFKFTVPGPDCSICASDFEQNNEDIPTRNMTDAPTFDLASSASPLASLESPKNIPFTIYPKDSPVPSDMLRSSMSVSPLSFPSRINDSSVTPILLANDGVLSDLFAKPLRQIKGYVLEDLNNDKSGEEPISGVIVRLLDANNTVLNESITDDKGVFVFSNLIPGFYYLNQITPTGFIGVDDSDGDEINIIVVSIDADDSLANVFVDTRISVIPTSFRSSLPSILPSNAPSGSATPSMYPSVEGNKLNSKMQNCSSSISGNVDDNDDKGGEKTRRRSVELTSEESGDNESSRSDNSRCQVQRMIVFENFEDYYDDQDLLDAGWSDAYLDVSQKGQTFTKFLGRFGQFPVDRNKIPSRVYAVPSEAEYLIVEFDFYEIDSWRYVIWLQPFSKCFRTNRFLFPVTLIQLLLIFKMIVWILECTFPPQ